jgi:hypothetical protein
VGTVEEVLVERIAQEYWRLGVAAWHEGKSSGDPALSRIRRSTESCATKQRSTVSSIRRSTSSRDCSAFERATMCRPRSTCRYCMTPRQFRMKRIPNDKRDPPITKQSQEVLCFQSEPLSEATSTTTHGSP